MNSTKKKLLPRNEQSANGYWIIPFTEKSQDSNVLLYFVRMLKKTDLRWAVKLTQETYNVEVKTEVKEDKKHPDKLKTLKIWISAA